MAWGEPTPVVSEGRQVYVKLWFAEALAIPEISGGRRNPLNRSLCRDIVLDVCLEGRVEVVFEEVDEALQDKTTVSGPCVEVYQPCQLGTERPCYDSNPTNSQGLLGRETQSRRLTQRRERDSHRDRCCRARRCKKRESVC